MTVEYRVISIGTLSRNRLWGEGSTVRTAHATTTQVKDEERVILVDPSLPAAALAARYNERTGGRLADVTDIFCTTLRPVHRRGIEAFPEAAWWTSQAELDGYRDHLESQAGAVERTQADPAEVQSELAIVGRFRPAPDKLTRQVSLFPLPGASPGAAGLLLTPPAMTVLIAGDAALTSEHLLRGQVWEGCADADAAMESLAEIIEIADIVIPGHDNLLITPRRW